LPVSVSLPALFFYSGSRRLSLPTACSLSDPQIQKHKGRDQRGHRRKKTSFLRREITEVREILAITDGAGAFPSYAQRLFCSLQRAPALPS
jgi:hypothetical protein